MYNLPRNHESEQNKNVFRQASSQEIYLLCTVSQELTGVNKRVNEESVDRSDPET